MLNKKTHLPPLGEAAKNLEKWGLGFFVWSAPSGSEFGSRISGSCLVGFDLCLLFELLVMICSFV